MDPVVELGVVPVDLGKESEVTSIEVATSGPSEIFSEGGGGADEREGSFPWSLNRDDQIKNLKENCRRAFWFLDHEWAEINSHPWFETVVEKLRADPCIELGELEIGCPPAFGNFRSLDVAVMMGDIIMVQQLLANRGPRHEVQINAPSLRGLTALHLAVLGRDGEIVDALLQKGADVNAPDIWSLTPLDFAYRYENFTLLKKLLKKDKENRSPLHVAVKGRNIDIMKKLSVQYANALDKNGRTPLHHLVLKQLILGNFSDIVQCLTKDNGVDVKALDDGGLSVFYVAVLCCKTELVMALLDSCKEKIRLNEACDKNLGPPIQIAYEGGERFKDIERALMECDPVKSYMETLYRDRQVYVDAANAILVGAALIASVTFASWLQPPLSYTSYSGEAYSSSFPAPPSNLSYVDVEHNLALRAFWIFNALSFYFAIGTVVCGARSVLPSPQLFIKKSVEKLAVNLLVTAVLLACSVLFVIVAFGIAGAVVLTPVMKYQWYMIGPAVVGGLLCLFSLCLLFKSMWESRPGTREKWSVSHRDYLKGHGYEPDYMGDGYD